MLTAMPHVFLSYVRDDVKRVQRFARDLRRVGVDVWLDRERIQPGQRWRDAIRAAIKSGALFVACFSRASALRAKSYMNEELVLAMEELRLRSTDREWFIPLRLDDSEIPSRAIGGGETLHDLQWVDLAHNWQEGIASIAAAAKRSADAARADEALRRAMTRAPRSARDAADVRRYAKVVTKALRRRHAIMAPRVTIDVAVVMYRESFDELMDIASSVTKTLERASLEYNSGVYSAFWDSIEKCAQQFAGARMFLQRLSKLRKQVAWAIAGSELDVLPDLTDQAARFGELIRMAQTHFEFAVIWEHRRTREAVAIGFKSLGDVVRNVEIDLQKAYAKLVAS
jgi:hypothetical protein